MTLRFPILVAIALMGGCAEPDPATEPYRPGPCNDTQLPAPARPIVCPDRVIRYDEAAQGAPGATRCVPFMATPCRCSNGAQGVDTCSTFGHPSGCFCDLPSAPGDIEGMGAPPPPLPPRLVAPLSGMRATSMRPTFRWVLPDGVTRARIELCDDRLCTRTRTTAEVTGGSWRPPQTLRPGVVFWRVTGASSTGTTVWSSATWEVGIPYRDTPVDSVNGPIRDVNGDSVDDVVLRSSYHDQFYYLALRFIPGYVGAAHAVAPIVYQLDREWSRLDYDLALGDVNGDGMSDVLTITSTGDALAHRLESEASFPVARILLGGSACPFESGLILSVPVALGAPPRYGSIGDFDGDGFGDVVVGSPTGAHLVRGVQEGLLRVPTDFVHVQMSVGAQQYAVLFAGDVDGDGYSDLTLGNYLASGRDGEVRILYGNPRSRLDERVDLLRPHGGDFGKTVSSLDLTGDGFAEIIVGSNGGFDIYSWSSGQLRHLQYVPIRQIVSTGYAPYFAAGQGDFDGNGRPDLSLQSFGIVYRSMDASGVVVEPVFEYSPQWGPNDNAEILGSSGDINGDGFDDLLAILARWPSRRTDLLLHLGGSLSFCAPVRAWALSDEGLLHP